MQATKNGDDDEGVSTGDDDGVSVSVSNGGKTLLFRV